jgi:glycosyltransferase involved in cell wall biosynthesis
MLWLVDGWRLSVSGAMLRHEPHPSRYSLLGATIVNLGISPGLLPGQQMLVRLKRMLGFFRASKWQPDVIHAFWAGETGVLAGLAGRLCSAPVLLSLAGGEMVALPEIQYGAQLKWRSRWQVALSIKLARRITVASQSMSDLAAQHGITAEYLPLGVDNRFFSPQKTMSGAPPWRLIHIASLNRVKDQPTLLRALKRVIENEQQVHLDIVGEDTLQGEIQALCSQLALDQYVTFHGFMPTDEMFPLLRRADLAILPSRHDAGPVATLEAAACGVPTVGTEVGYMADWSPQRALAVPMGDDDALAQAILSLLRAGPRRAAMGRAAQEWAKAHDADWTAAQFERLYTELLAHHGHSPLTSNAR